MKLTVFRLGIIQSKPTRLAVAENLNRTECILRSAPPADLWLLPELAFTGYQFRDRAELASVAEPAGDGETYRWASQLASSLNCAIAYGFAEKDEENIYNSAVLIYKNKTISIYRKTHLFNEEKRYFDHGNLGFPVFKLGEVNIGMMICFDWIFPEAARTIALAGADLILHPANLVLPYCLNSMYTRALENGVYTATANRIGTEELDGTTLVFQGGSIIYSPRGGTEMKMEFGAKVEEKAEVVTLDLSLSRDKQFTATNHLFTDRKTEYYSL